MEPHGAELEPSLLLAEALDLFGVAADMFLQVEDPCLQGAVAELGAALLRLEQHELDPAQFVGIAQLLQLPLKFNLTCTAGRCRL